MTLTIRNSGSDPFTLLVVDSLIGRSSEQGRLDGSVAEIRERLGRLPFVQVLSPESRHDYLVCIRSATVGLAPFRLAPAWSMSCVDVMACGRPLLAPDSGPFPELLGPRSTLLFRDRADFFDKLEMLLCSEQHWRSEAEYCSLRSRAFDRLLIGERFARVFERAISGGQG